MYVDIRKNNSWEDGVANSLALHFLNFCEFEAHCQNNHEHEPWGQLSDGQWVTSTETANGTSVAPLIHRSGFHRSGPGCFAADGPAIDACFVGLPVGYPRHLCLHGYMDYRKMQYAAQFKSLRGMNIPMFLFDIYTNGYRLSNLLRDAVATIGFLACMHFLSVVMIFIYI